MGGVGLAAHSQCVKPGLNICQSNKHVIVYMQTWSVFYIKNF